jgi:phosphate-selective porin OprO and OprP
MKMSHRGRLAIGVAAGLLLLGATPSFADDTGNVKGQMDQLQEQIHQLQQQLQLLQTQVNQAQAQAPTAPPAPSNAPKVIETVNHHFGFSSADGQNTVELTGRLHIDTGDYLNYDPQSKTTDRNLEGGINLRRARIGVTGQFMGDWRYNLIYDFGGSSDSLNPNNFLANGNSSSSPTASNTALSGVENAYITYNGFYKHGQQFPVAIDFGIADAPWTLDEATSSNDIMFMERSSAQVIATEYGGGDSRSLFGFRSNDDRYWVGAYITGPQSGALHTDGASCVNANNAVDITKATQVTPCVVASPTGNTQGILTGNGPQYAFLTRASYQILQDPEYSLHIGFNFGDLFEPRAGNNISAISLSDRPELRIDPSTFLSTGSIPSTGGLVFGGELAAAYENAFLQGEYYHYTIDEAKEPGVSSTGTPRTLDFNGGYVEASYSFGGQRKYNPAAGAYTGVIPDRVLAWGSDGWGAVELAGRFSYVDLNDGQPFTGPSHTACSFCGVLGGRQTTYAFGINYYPNLNMRFMLDYEHVNLYIPTVVGSGSSSHLSNTNGASFDEIAARTQITF